MNHCLPVPLWQIEKKKQGQGEEEEGVVPHVQSHSIPSMSNCEVAELTWENGHLSMHGLVAPKNPDPNGTLESIVHHVSNHYPDDVAAWFSDYPHKVSGRNPAEIVPGRTSGSEPVKDGTWPEYGLPPPSSEEPAGAKTYQSVSGSATFGREADTTLMTWASFESPASMRTNGTDKADCTSKCKRKSEADADEDWGCLRGSKRNSEEGDNKGRSGRSLVSSSKRGRAAAVHNQSERKRRDRINQRMKALQKLVPNSSKTDKASMLDEVIEYLKQLQAQLQIMNLRNMPHMMMPMGLPQQLQMAYMARMGMGMGLGMGMGMMDMNTVGHVASPTIPPFIHPGTAAAFVPPHLVAPPLMPTGATTRGASLDPSPTPSTSMADPYSTFLAQSMNMELYHKMASLYQQMQQPGHANRPTLVNANMKE